MKDRLIIIIIFGLNAKEGMVFMTIINRLSRSIYLIKSSVMTLVNNRSGRSR